MLRASDVVCPFCATPMAAHAANAKWRFFRCEAHGFWTSRDAAMQWPAYSYNDARDFINDETDWGLMVRQCRRVLEHKFSIAGMVGGRFLDIGCSEGTYVAAGLDLGWEATGTELDTAKVDRGKKRGLDLRTTHVARDGKTDFILVRHVIEHVPDFMGLLQDAAKTLAPEGVLWVECPNQASVSARLKRRRIMGDRHVGAMYPPTHIHAFEPQTMRAIAASLAMRCECVITYSGQDSRWYPPYQSSGSVGRSMAQRCFARLGYGTDMAAVYRHPRHY